MERAGERVSGPESADWALAHGRSTLTTEELANLLQVSEDQVRRRLHAPAQRGEWVTPARGLWAPVPPEYRTWGAPPGVELIDAIMSHLGIAYYIGWLSAAALHGAAHQAAQVFQVAVGRQVRNRSVGRTRFDFAQRDVTQVPVVEFPTRSGSATVSSVAATMLDIATDVGRSGGIDNAATVICELAEHDSFVVQATSDLASRFPAAAIRRIGYILDRFGDHEDLDVLREAARAAGATPARLDPAGPPSGPVDRTWMVYLNRDVEPDI